MAQRQTEQIMQIAEWQESNFPARLMVLGGLLLNRVQGAWRSRNQWGILAALQMAYLFVGSSYLSAANVRHFGARGDGQTDDTAAIETAIRSTASGTLMFPAGVYRIKRTLN